MGIPPSQALAHPTPIQGPFKRREKEAALSAFDLPKEENATAQRKEGSWSPGPLFA